MKTGKEHISFLQELQAQKFAKKDFIADTRKVQVAVDENAPFNLALNLPEIKTADEVAVQTAPVPATFNLSRLAISQICSRLNIPFKYAERLFTDHPDLLAFQMNALFSREPQTRMIRTLGDKCRAFLSDRYRILDNFDIATTVLPIVEQLIGAKWRECVQSCDVTETKMYIKVVHPFMKAEIPIPENMKMGQGHNWFVDSVQAGITIQNSEVGLGRVVVSPAIFTKRCTNYAIMDASKFAHVHLGRKQGDGADVEEILSDQTKALDDAAVLSKVSDVTKAALDGTLFEKQVKLLTDARSDTIEVNPVKMVEAVKDKSGLTEAEADQIINNLISGAELTRYGLHNAITRAAEKSESYDRATELEALGGQIIELPKSDWQVLLKKAA